MGQFAVDAGGLPPGLKTHALVTQPYQRLEAAVDGMFNQIGMAAILRDARHVVEKVFRGVTPELDVLHIVIAKIDDFGQVIHIAIHHPHAAACVRGVAAACVLGRRIQHEHASTLFACGQRCTAGRITGADHNHIHIFKLIHTIPVSRS